MTRRTTTHRKRRQKQNTGLLAALITLGILFLVVYGVSKGFEYHEAQLQQASIDSSKALIDAATRKKQAFIKKVAPESQRLQQQYHILASVTIAQAILESDWGSSQLATEYNNLFGVKSDDPANSRILSTQEYVDGNWKTIKARFKVYDSYQASLIDHAQLLAQGTTWNKNQYQHVLQADNYQAAAQGLQQDGYATDPEYAQKLIQIIQKYNLTQYD